MTKTQISNQMSEMYVSETCLNFLCLPPNSFFFIKNSKIYLLDSILESVDAANQRKDSSPDAKKC